MTFSPGIQTGKSRSIFEAFSEVIAIRIAYLGRNLGNLVFGIGKQLLGLFHSVFCQILIESLSGLAFEKSAYIRCGKVYMAADIFYGKCIVHIVPADIILDHKDRGIFRLGIFRIFKILGGFFFQSFVKLFVGEGVV